MHAEAGLLHHDRTAACQICGAAVVKPAAVGGDIRVLRHAELASRLGDVAPEVVEGAGDLDGVSNPPAGGGQPFHRYVGASDRDFERLCRRMRQLEKLREFEVLCAVRYPVEPDGLA